jgi:hypothetical protein
MPLIDWPTHFQEQTSLIDDASGSSNDIQFVRQTRSTLQPTWNILEKQRKHGFDIGDCNQELLEHAASAELCMHKKF